MKEFLVNAYTNQYMKWMDKYSYKIKTSQYGTYIVFAINGNQQREIIKDLKKSNIKYKIYEKRWERSSNYRKNFFDANKGPYRCRYCHRRLKKDYLVVDHLYPIAKGKYNPTSRYLLYIRGIHNINDIRNLVPSCYKCNEKKGDKLGLWYIRGLLGKYKIYWIIRRIIIFSLLIIIPLLIYYFIKYTNVLNNGLFQIFLK